MTIENNTTPLGPSCLAFLFVHLHMNVGLHIPSPSTPPAANKRVRVRRADCVRVNDTRINTTLFFVLFDVDAPQAYPFLPYHPIRVYKVVSTYAELQFNKLMRLVPLFGHFARFQLTNSKKTDMIK